MTPEEKAKELVNKYDDTLTYLESKSKAKKCALIAVEEIINTYQWHGGIDYDEKQFWEAVEQNIINL